MKKNINKRCPLSAECERKNCDYVNHELDCEYYLNNGIGDNTIPDQEDRRQALERQERVALEEKFFEADNFDDETPPEQESPSGRIEYIPLDLIRPHKDNPRKDLGDLSELAESIKVNGILQNLTVVPSDDGYTCIIGHRRLAAAKLAGIETAPCVVVEMTEKEQVSTMLTENMQREDLTVYEQAQGFQMMLDFGDTVEQIAEKSGFSTTTVRRRVKLLDLDPDKFKESEARGATLFDYMELDKIEDPDRKNAVLEKIGTPDFRNVLKRTIEEEAEAKVLAEYEAEVSKFARKVGLNEVDFAAYTNYRSYYSYTKKVDVEIPKDADSWEYLYTAGRYSISVYRKRPQEDNDAQAAAEAERERKDEELKARLAKLKAATERMASLRRGFADSLSTTAIKKHLTDIVAYAVTTGYDFDICVGDDLLETLCIGADGEDYELTPEGVAEAIKSPEKTLFMLVYLSMENDECYYNYWDGSYDANEILDILYDFLGKLGYEMSEEEKAMQNGSHELFYKIEEAQ